MATLTSPREAAETGEAGDMVVALNVGPDGLDAFLSLVRRGSVPRIKYREGSLTLVSPSSEHESGGDRIDGMIKAVCAVLGIGYRSTASTLLRRPGIDSGIEPDKSYYVEREPAVRGVRKIDLSVLPPPDLAVEVVVSHGAEKSLTICRELGIPEVWVYKVLQPSLEFLVLGEAGRYAASAASRSFPFLTPDDVLPWVELTVDEPDNLWESRLRDWVRDVLGPRVRPGGEGGHDVAPGDATGRKRGGRFAGRGDRR